MANASTLSNSAVPWRGWAAVCGVACLPVGLLWDISWHESIGRDTFWTPAHIIIQLGGILPALLFAGLMLKTTFRGTEVERESAVTIWGFRAPLGAWVTMWGAAAMVTSAPFDDWWHNTYGLDVQIVSPPHSVLGLGMMAVTAGVLLYVFSSQNRAGGQPARAAALLCAISSGVMLTLIGDFLTEFSFPNQQHAGMFYLICAGVFPAVLVLTARASRMRWAATIAALCYMTVLVLMVWILPLFPAQPKLAPIYHPVTHMVPPPFPLLLVLPALAIDLVMLWMARPGVQSTQPGSRGRMALRQSALAATLAAAFVAVFIPVQWFFSIFLLSDAADNWVFARSGHWPYFSHVGPQMNRFWVKDEVPLHATELGLIFLLAFISAAIGLSRGNFLLKVRR